MTSRRQALAVTVLLVSGLAAAGCTSNDDSDAGGASDSGFAGGRASSPERNAVADMAQSAPAAKPEQANGSVTAAFNQSLIRVGAVTLEAPDIGKVIAKIDGLVASSGGQIASEETTSNDDGVKVSSRIELKVPVSEFSASLRAVEGFGDQISVNSSTKDVTAAVADVNSRVDSAKDSIQQLRALFSRATKLRDVIALEHELSAREADLESLQAQQRDLSASTTMSTIVVNVSRPDASTETAGDQAGFLAGLRSGWDGLVTFVAATAHGLGLVLPLGLLGLVVAFFVRMVVLRVRLRQVPRSSE